MPIVQPPLARHTVQDDGATLRITIPSHNNTFFLIFIGFWLIGWAVGEIFAGGIAIRWLLRYWPGSPTDPDMLRALTGGGMLVILFWLAIWTAGGAFALYVFLWQLVGKEIIEVGYTGIKIQRAIGRLGRKKEYLASHIKELRTAPLIPYPSTFGWRGSYRGWGIAGGAIAFDYGAQTFRFGGGVDEAEAKQIVEQITARFPQYRERETGIT